MYYLACTGSQAIIYSLHVPRDTNPSEHGVDGIAVSSERYEE